jgi:hypothetical protein
MYEPGTLVRHRSSGVIGIVLFVSHVPESTHHLEVWVAIDTNTRWWSALYTEVICT